MDKIERPECLTGATYKIRTQSDYAIYITINDMVDASGLRNPAEMFINSKNPEHLQWVQTMTRLLSAMFRAGLPPSLIIDELTQINDATGGYFIKGGKVPSTVAHIGKILEQHCNRLAELNKAVDKNI